MKKNLKTHQKILELNGIIKLRIKINIKMSSIEIKLAAIIWFVIITFWGWYLWDKRKKSKKNDNQNE